MQRGDAFTLLLEIKVKDTDIPITPDNCLLIEMTINKEASSNCVRKTTENNEIVWRQDIERWSVYLSQQDTFTLKRGRNTVQVRVYSEVDDIPVVCSNDIMGCLNLGDVNSNEVLDYEL